MAMDYAVQRLELGDVILLRLPGQDEDVEATVMKDIVRTETTVQVTLRVTGRDDFVQEWLIGESVTVVRGPRPQPGQAVDSANRATGAQVEEMQPVPRRRRSCAWCRELVVAGRQRGRCRRAPVLCAPGACARGTSSRLALAAWHSGGVPSRIAAQYLLGFGSGSRVAQLLPSRRAARLGVRPPGRRLRCARCRSRHSRPVSRVAAAGHGASTREPPELAGVVEQKDEPDGCECDHQNEKDDLVGVVAELRTLMQLGTPYPRLPVVAAVRPSPSHGVTGWSGDTAKGRTLRVRSRAREG